MDRLSPEQEMALQQTRQEKWMKMAKEAISSKEKIEPFQFFPEASFGCSGRAVQADSIITVIGQAEQYRICNVAAR